MATKTTTLREIGYERDGICNGCGRETTVDISDYCERCIKARQEWFERQKGE